MLINSSFQIWKVAAGDAARPTLGYVSVQDLPGAVEDPDTGDRDGLAIATDGFVMAVVPVIREYADLAWPGLIGPDAFVKAWQVWRKIPARLRPDDVKMALGVQPDFVGLADGSMVPRYHDDKTTLGTFPDVSGVVPKRPTPQDRAMQDYALMAFAFQPNYMVKVCQAIGTRLTVDGPGSRSGTTDPRFVPGNASKNGIMVEPMVVEPATADIGQNYEPPFGLIMPMHQNVKGADPANYWLQDRKR